ncbi:hypothetical protein FIBSPDRAFT_1028312 [Athelia psychrophila]|uniref:Uncharacterized protein n=1 Tax=Athelia psychrophila TaxID=1759441 RepID=A0A166GUU0_9AGAM|nr:hypothetical protein FIBSPDRAFT_1028312 [Fibularhizoctonia sp. CBS 109695]
MGGFYLDDKARGKSIGPLSGEDMAILVRHGCVLPAAAEIEDKSNGDWFSKGVALLQTFWFLVQCIARRAQHLSITQLEIVTLSYCVTNLMIYTCWWHKPLNVDRPIHIILDITPFAPKDQAYLRRKRDQRVPVWREIGCQFASTGPNAANEPINIAGDAADAGLLNAYSLFGTIAIYFGALHFIAWSYPFPSHTQRVLWRVCCIALTCTPVMSPMVKKLLTDVELSPVAKLLLLLLAGVFALLYIFARLATMVISFTTLGSLPPSATDTVQWTRFIPHF